MDTKSSSFAKNSSPSCDSARWSKAQNFSVEKKFLSSWFQSATASIGLVVDRLAGEQELVIKALDDMLMSTSSSHGASVLGDGRVVLILNISTVVERVGRHAKRAGVGA